MTLDEVFEPLVTPTLAALVFFGAVAALDPSGTAPSFVRVFGVAAVLLFGYVLQSRMD